MDCMGCAGFVFRRRGVVRVLFGKIENQQREDAVNRLPDYNDGVGMAHHLIWKE